MRSVISEDVVDLSAIYDDDVELVSVARHPSIPSTTQVLYTQRETFQLQWQQCAEDRLAALRAFSAYTQTNLIQSLADEISAATQVMGELLGCEQVGVRVRTLERPMCPRFHTDKVPCRMLITMAGPATEWIPDEIIALAPVVDCDTHTVAVRHSASVKQLSTGDWSLLKGGSWNERFNGVVHRSPPQGSERLLVSLDPLFA